MTPRWSSANLRQASDLRPEWVDLALSLGVTPRACRPYRAKTKGKVERVIREVKEDLLPWLTGQPLPPRPSLADYDALARRWALEIVGSRRHRTTGRIVTEELFEEQPLLVPIPSRLLQRSLGTHSAAAEVIDLAVLKAAGSEVEHRKLDDYARALR